MPQALLETQSTPSALRFQQSLLRKPSLSEAQMQERLEVMEAEREIRDLLVAYAVHYDAGDLDALVDLFTEDALLKNMLDEHVGHEQIRAAYAFLTGHLGQSMHFICNVTVRLDSPDSARASSYLHSIAVRRRDGYTYGTGGTYSDRLQRRDGRWRIAERVVTGYIPYDLVGTPADYDRFADHD